MIRRCTATVVALAVLVGLASGLAQAHTIRELDIDGLSGTLVLPEGAGPFPAVLMLAGSGPVDRDGNVPGARNDSLRLLAENLAQQGIASLRVDKRGIGKSAGAAPKEEELRLETYVVDALAWLRVLRDEARVGHVTLLGHSEGALIATLAAQRADVDGLILVAGAGAPAPQIIARQLLAAGVSAELREKSQDIASRLSRGETVSSVPAELAGLYRLSVQPYLISWFAYDPAVELAEVRVPVLIIQGTSDLQVGTGDAQRLAVSQPKAELRMIENMNHVLKDAPLDRAANIATYARQDPISPELVSAVAEFVLRRER